MTTLLVFGLFFGWFVGPALVTIPIVRYVRRRRERLQARDQVGRLGS